MIRRSPAHMGVRMGEQNLANWLNVFIYSAVMSGELVPSDPEGIR